MLTRLSRGDATIGELGEPFGITKGAVTKHVKVLERAGLLKRDVQGRVHRCELDPTQLELAQTWVENVTAFWEARFDALADYLDDLQGKQRKKKR